MNDFVAAVLFLFVLNMMTAGVFYVAKVLPEKAKCEEDLPRNVRCVWAAPQHIEGKE